MPLHSYLEKTLHNRPIEQVERRSDQFLAFGLSMSLVQAWSERSDMSRLPDSLSACIATWVQRTWIDSAR